MRHDLVRDACDAGKVRQSGVYQDADLSTKPLEIQRFFKHTKTVLNIV